MLGFEFVQLGRSQARTAVEPQHIQRPQVTLEVEQTGQKAGRGGGSSSSGGGGIRRSGLFISCLGMQSLSTYIAINTGAVDAIFVLAREWVRYLLDPPDDCAPRVNAHK